MHAQINIPNIGFKSLTKLKLFLIKQYAIIVGNKIANDNGPFTSTPNEKTTHIIIGYKYLALIEFSFFSISFSKKYC